MLAPLERPDVDVEGAAESESMTATSLSSIAPDSRRRSL